MGIALLFTINIVSNSFASELGDFYKRADFDIMLRPSQDGDNYTDKLQKMNGVSNIYETYELNGIKVKEENSRISALQGTDTMEFFDYWKIEMPGNGPQLIEKMNTGRYIMISNILKSFYKVGIGDKLTLTLNGKEHPYEIIGFFDSLRDNGSHALISKKYFAEDSGLKNYTDIYIKTSTDADHVKKSIERQFSGMQPWVMTINELEDMNKKDMNQLFSLLTAFCQLLY